MSMPEKLSRMSASPSPRLQGYIDRLWGWEQAFGCAFPQMLPGTGAECVFNYGDPLRIVDVNSGQAVLAPRSFLLCNRQQVLQFEATGRVGFLSVRFCAGQLRHLIRAPFLEVQNRLLPISDLWPHGAATVEERIDEANGFSERVALLESFLALQLKVPDKPLLDQLISTLYYAPSLRVERLAAAVGWSRRNLDRRFRETFGLSPKSFARIARLQKVARNLALSRQGRLVDFVLEAGFFDQSHFYHDLFDLTGLSASGFRAGQQEGGCFYHPVSRDNHLSHIIRT